MKIVQEYLSKRSRYFDHGRPLSERTARSSRVISFLEFASGHVVTIRDLLQKHYDEFMGGMKRSDCSTETQYKYRLAIAEFVRHARLPISVKTSRKTLRSKKLDRILDEIRTIKLDEDKFQLVSEIIRKHL